MAKRKKGLLIFISFCSLAAAAQVKYDEGAIYVKGLTFLQDSKDSTLFYYLPRYPRLSKNDQGLFELLCLKYVGDRQETSGGLFHALIDFTVPDSILKTCEPDLAKIVPGAHIKGQVPLMEIKKDGEEENVESSFEIVSAVLSNKTGKESLTRSVVTSGHAPFTPGSKAAVASLLNPAGTTLLWNSFTGPTSDVSIAINGYYEATVRAYNAVVTAEMSVIYKHFSEMSANQIDYNKEQIRKVVDSLIKNGSIKVDVSDRSAGLGIKISDQEGILSVVTTKLTEIMFDSKSGWSADPPIVDPDLGFNPVGRQGDRKGGVAEAVGAVGDAIIDVVGAMPISSWFTKKRDKNPKYVTDNQYVLKDYKFIKSSKFYLNLSKSVSIKVPYHTAGNLGGVFSQLGNDERYFRIVNMNDAAYDHRSLNFQVDGDFVDAFDDIINFVTVNFRKKYNNGQGDVTQQLNIYANDLKKDVRIKEISYPRLGLTGSDWLNYEYQVIWSFKGKTEPVRVPASETQWLKSNAPAISLIPPLVKDYIELDADRQEFQKQNVSSVSLNFASFQAGEKKVVRSAILRAEDKNSTNKIVIYHDKGSPVVYQPTWHSKENGKAVMDLSQVTSGYLFLVPPSADKFIK